MSLDVGRLPADLVPVGSVEAVADCASCTGRVAGIGRVRVCGLKEALRKRAFAPLGISVQPAVTVELGDYLLLFVVMPSVLQLKGGTRLNVRYKASGKVRHVMDDVAAGRLLP